jgi:BarA-like signal transduction histidine kinase
MPRGDCLMQKSRVENLQTLCLNTLLACFSFPMVFLLKLVRNQNTDCIVFPLSDNYLLGSFVVNDEICHLYMYNDKICQLFLLDVK